MLKRSTLSAIGLGGALAAMVAPQYPGDHPAEYRERKKPKPASAAKRAKRTAQRRARAITRKRG